MPCLYKPMPAVLCRVTGPIWSFRKHNERIRQVHFTTHALQLKIQSWTKVCYLSRMPNTKKRRTDNSRSGSSFLQTEYSGMQLDKWIKHLSDRELTQPERHTGLSKRPKLHYYTKTRPSCDDHYSNRVRHTRNDDLPVQEAEQHSDWKSLQLWPMLNHHHLTSPPRRDMPWHHLTCRLMLCWSLHSITAKSLQFQRTITPVPRWKETLTATIGKRCSIAWKGITIDRGTYNHLYPGEAIPCFYGLPKIDKE